MDSRAPWFTLLPAALAVAPPAHATVYLTVPAAQAAMFPSAQMIDHVIKFTPDQRKAIAKAAGVGSFDPVLRVWEARSRTGRLGWFIVDRVLGKHDFITYAVALTPDGAVSGLEILEYRETYGGEVRNERWRAQFMGKRPGISLKLDKDIKNISGATLSSRHVTDGVRRLLVTYEMLLKNG